MRDLQALVDAADDAALLAAVDGLSANRQWDTLADLARRCREAVEFGKQLWGVAMHIDYRLAWEGPPAHAAATLQPGAGRFSLGPLTEVAASTHTWDELAPYLEDPATTATVAQERVIRGEDLRGRVTADVVELPLVLAAWEPDYALPRYSDRSARLPAPAAAGEVHGRPVALPRGRVLAPDGASQALEDLVEAWTAESTGTSTTVVVEGTAEEAIGAVADAAVVRAISPSDALALAQWAGASGGSKGRRRGGAAGRFAALWATASLADVPWPDGTPEDVEDFADALGEAVAELDWRRWRRDRPEQGWFLRIAVSDPASGRAWAIEATDAVEDQDPAVPEVPAG